MTDTKETDIVDQLRSACTDWDGARLSPASEPMDGLHCDVLFDAATEIESLRHDLSRSMETARAYCEEAEGLRKDLEICQEAMAQALGSLKALGAENGFAAEALRRALRRALTEGKEG